MNVFRWQWIPVLGHVDIQDQDQDVRPQEQRVAPTTVLHSRKLRLNQVCPLCMKLFKVISLYWQWHFHCKIVEKKRLFTIQYILAKDQCSPVLALLIMYQCKVELCLFFLSIFFFILHIFPTIVNYKSKAGVPPLQLGRNRRDWFFCDTDVVWKLFPFPSWPHISCYSDHKFILSNW